MSFQPDYDDLVRLYKKFEATGKVPDRLYDFVYEICREAQEKWLRTYDRKQLDAEKTRKTLLLALLKTAAYLLTVNKDGLVTVLHGAPTAKGLKWRIGRFFLQMMQYSMKYACKQAEEEVDKWLDRRLQLQKGKKTSKKILKCMQRT